MSMQSTASRLNPLGFFNWWLGELAGLVPRALRRGLSGSGRVLVVERQDGTLSARQRAGGRERELGRIDLRRASDRDRQRFARMLTRAGRGDSEVVLRLPAAEVLERQLELPAAADADLRRALYFEIDRQTPFRPEETHFGYAVTQRHADGKRLSVELTIVPRKVVENALASLAEWEIEPDFVEVESAPDRPPARVSLHQDDARRGRFSFAGLINGLLVVVLVAEVALAVRIPIEGRRQVAETLAAEVNTARQRADEARRLQAELDSLLQSRRGLQQSKLQAPSAVAVLEEVTRLLPDDVWLTNFRLDDGEVQLSGFASTAASLIGLLDSSEHFQTPRFLSPVTQDGQSGKERFSLSFGLEPTAVPGQ